MLLNTHVRALFRRASRRQKFLIPERIPEVYVEPFLKGSLFSFAGGYRPVYKERERRATPVNVRERARGKHQRANRIHVVIIERGTGGPCRKLHRHGIRGPFSRRSIARRVSKARPPGTPRVNGGTAWASPSPG